MAESNEDKVPVTLDTNALIEEAVSAMQVETSAEATTTTDTTDIVSKAFTSVEGGDNSEVQYVTMTPEEAASAGVEEEEQMVTTSLQFDPANPSVLYTADGTLINQSDLSPEEQALVQAALQQHLAEQEAEQQLAMIEQNEGAATNLNGLSTQTESITSGASLMTVDGQQLEGNVSMVNSTTGTVMSTVAELATQSSTDPVAVITPAPVSSMSALSTGAGVNLASPSTNASQIVQTLADNVRRQQEYIKAQNLLNRVKNSSKSELPDGFRYEDKIVIRQGQPQVVKMPVKNTPAPRRPEIPAALANLMPKIEVGKDGSQVIRIHQSQISADQLKSLQENPNVRLVFRPASSSRGRPTNSVANNGPPRKRGRPRKNYDNISSRGSLIPGQPLDDSPPAKTRYGRTTKMPYYQKDYLSPGAENGDEDREVVEDMVPRPPLPGTHYVPGKRGRPPGSTNKNTMSKAYRRSTTYANKIEQLREQQYQQDEELANARLSIVPQKPVLTSVEQAISTRRKNKLRELLSACSEEEIMEVALPHLARVFSLWEFLVMKVEKNKLSRVYFADVYKEYEVLHRYVARLTEKYKEAVAQGKDEKNDAGGEVDKETMETEKKNFIKIRCKKLAESLGLQEGELEDAFIDLIDSQETYASKATQPTAKQTESDSSKPATDNATTGDTKTSKEKEAKAVDETTNESTSEPTKADEPVAAATAQSDSGGDASAVAAVATSASEDVQITQAGTETATVTEGGEATGSGTQIIQIGTGDDKQFIEVPEGYTLIQTPEGLVMSQPGTTLSQADDGTIYVTQEDGTTAPLNSQKGVPLETVESLLSLEGQQ